MPDVVEILTVEGTTPQDELSWQRAARKNRVAAAGDTKPGEPDKHHVYLPKGSQRDAA
jgi:hypothetical protein